MKRRTVLHVIEVNGKVFTHELSLDNDSTYIIDEDGLIVFEVSSLGTMSNGDIKTFGSFYLDPHGKWFFSLLNGGYNAETKIVTDQQDLLKAEIAIFEFLLATKT